MRERKKKEEEKTKRKEVGGCDGRNNDEEIFDSVVPIVSQKHWSLAILLARICNKGRQASRDSIDRLFSENPCQRVC